MGEACPFSTEAQDIWIDFTFLIVERFIKTAIENVCHVTSLLAAILVQNFGNKPLILQFARNALHILTLGATAQGVLKMVLGKVFYFISEYRGYLINFLILLHLLFKCEWG